MTFAKTKIALGSNSEPKKEGVVRAFGLYWESVELVTFRASGLSQQPIGWREIRESLTKRLDENPSNSAWDFSVALESGIIPDALQCGATTLADAKDEGVIGLSMAAIRVRRSQETFYGVSPAFVIPTEVLELMTDNCLELAKAFKSIYNFDAKGKSGVIGTLSRQRIRRTDFEHLAVLMALWQIVYRISRASKPRDG